jgi:hypothetical protein
MAMTDTEPINDSTSDWSVLAFFGGALLLSIAFFIETNVIENVTSNVLVWHFHVLGTPERGSYEEYRLDKQQYGDLMTEFAWAIPAAIVYLIAMLAIPPRRGFRLSWRAFPVGLIGALAYSWVRWGLDLTKLRVGEGTDFLIAMSLAAVAGVLTGIVRKDRHPERSEGSGLTRPDPSLRSG